MQRKILATAAVLGFIGIILGAFGAHALKAILEPDRLASYETGVRYQLYHALFLLFLGSTSAVREKARKIIYNLTVFGVVLFSGSIYLLSLQTPLGIDLKMFGIVTPIGGLLMIVGWFWLFIDLIRNKS